MSRTNIVTSKILREQRNEFPQEFIPGYLLRVMKDHTRVYGDIPLFTDWNTGDTLTVTQLISECHLIAAEFRRRGIRRGEFVCCLVYSNVHYYSFALASWLCGCIVTCLQHGFSQEMVLNIINETKCKLLLCDQESAGRCAQARLHCPLLEDIFVLGHSDGCLPFQSLLQGGLPTVMERSEAYDPNEAILMVFSSGTTGFPKGVLLTHLNIYSYLLTARPQPNPEMRILFVPRLCNIFGIYYGLRGLLLHARTFIMSTYSDELILDAIHQVQPERLLVYLPHILAIVQKLDGAKCETSSIRGIFTAGMPVSHELQAKLFRKIPSIENFFTFYGMTEFAAGTMSHLREYESNTYNKRALEEKHRLKPNSVGMILPMNQMKVIDQTSGRALGVGQLGEICLKGPSAFQCYWNNPKATEEVKSSDGWVHTGDIGYYDQDGDVFFVQRSKELIKYLGHHVVPAVLEEILKSHEAVEDAAVIGVHSGQCGELARAYVVKAPNFGSVKAEELLIFVNDRVHPEERLRAGLAFLEKIPRNCMGKTLRNLLRERAKIEFESCSSDALIGH